MTARHQSPEYRKNARLIRTQTTHAGGGTCIGCGAWIDVARGEQFDVGHRDDKAGNHLSNLGPQHRGENRRHGGHLGARITNTTKRRERRLGRW